eukprot:TRINITY_DN13618_c0_g1_i2.p1 TRINITY_DN13618_c0_g1~~TRINITY_DN13618_c0_g1_i2.p1  ORF type:complete len:855 (-),score=108.92 TRINITY_DN13618_c0_g1_i2:275-2839(-)
MGDVDGILDYDILPHSPLHSPAPSEGGFADEHVASEAAAAGPTVCSLPSQPTVVARKASAAASAPEAAKTPPPGQHRVVAGPLLFFSDFDSGNMGGVQALDSLSSKGDPEFRICISADCQGLPWQNEYRTWFHFGIALTDQAAASQPVPPETKSTDGLTVKIILCHMNNQSKLYRFGYRPWVRSLPAAPKWRRLANTHFTEFAFNWTGEVAEGYQGLELSWRCRLDPAGSTYFAFCVPFGCDHCQDLMQNLEFNLRGIDSNHARGLGTLSHGGGQALRRCPPPDPNAALRCLSAAIQEDWVPKPGESIYFHRQHVANSLDGRLVDLLTVTAADPPLSSAGPVQSDVGVSKPSQTAGPPRFCRPLDPLPEELIPSGAVAAPPLLFPERKLVFVSARVHPGETPGQFAFLGFLRFLLSADPRAAALRQQYVFKLVPMLNPDGVARGHYRTNSRGVNLNRFYDNPKRDEHESVWTVKEVVRHWAKESRLHFYMDFHAHASKRGCFFLANKLLGAEQTMNMGYARLCQLNSPHFDLEGSEFAEASANEQTGKDGFTKEGSSRVAIHQETGLVHTYTLECNYHTGRYSRPVASPRGLPLWADWPGYDTPKQDPALYDASSWAQVGEALAVSLLDLYGHNCHSRIPKSRQGTLSKLLGNAAFLKKSEVPQRERPCGRPSCCWGGGAETKGASGADSARARPQSGKLPLRTNSSNSTATATTAASTISASSAVSSSGASCASPASPARAGSDSSSPVARKSSHNKLAATTPDMRTKTLPPSHEMQLAVAPLNARSSPAAKAAPPRGRRLLPHHRLRQLHAFRDEPARRLAEERGSAARRMRCRHCHMRALHRRPRSPARMP